MDGLRSVQQTVALTASVQMRTPVAGVRVYEVRAVITQMEKETRTNYTRYPLH